MVTNQPGAPSKLEERSTPGWYHLWKCPACWITWTALFSDSYWQDVSWRKDRGQKLWLDWCVFSLMCDGLLPFCKLEVFIAWNNLLGGPFGSLKPTSGLPWAWSKNKLAHLIRRTDALKISCRTPALSLVPKLVRCQHINGKLASCVFWTIDLQSEYKQHRTH